MFQHNKIDTLTHSFASIALLPLIAVFLFGMPSFSGTSFAVGQDVVETKNGTIPSFSVTYDTKLSKGDSIKLVVEDSEDCSVTSGSVKPSSDDGWTKGAKNEYMATIPENYSGKHIGRFGGRMKCEGGGGSGSGDAEPPSWSGVANASVQTDVSKSYDKSLYVDVKTGSDDNPGTKDEPLRTIQEAMKRASDYKEDGRSVHVMIADGTYRESVQFAYSNYNGNGTGAPVLVEGAGPTATVIKGSDEFEPEEWQSEGNGVFSHSWTKDWGVSDDPTGGYIEDCENHSKYCANSPRLVLRREMVFVNGKRMRQVLSADAMEPGTFRVDQTNDRLYLQPPADDNFSESTVEVSVRSRGWFTDLEKNLTIRNLGVKHVATPWKNGLGAIVLAGSNHTIENVFSVQNNHIGLNLRGNDTTVRNCILNQNGHSGVSATEVKNLLLEGSVVNANNWRGALGGYTGWDVGNKFFKGRDITIRDTSFNYNKSRGFWFDNDLKNALIEDVTLKGNLRDNIFLEQLQGPVTLRRVKSTESDGYGLLLGSAANVTVKDSRLVNNQKGGIHVSGLESGREFTNFVSGEKMTVNTRHFSLQNSVISGVSGGVKAGSKNKGRFLIGTTFGPTWDDFLSTYEADHNTWYESTTPKAFEWTGNELIDFETWQNRTGEDQNSVFRKPSNE